MKKYFLIIGEKIYNSAGDLVAIVNNNNNECAEYRISAGKVVYYNIKNKQTGEERGGRIWDDKACDTYIKTYDNIYYGTDYDSSGNVAGMDKSIQNKDNTVIDTYYNLEDKEYNVYTKYFDNGKEYFSRARFNDKGICKEAQDNTEGEYTNLNFVNNTPYSSTIHKTELIKNGITINDLDLSDTEPIKCPDINYEQIYSLNGEKTYFSNGKIEKLITDNGNIYEFNYMGGLEKIKNERYEAEVMHNDKDLVKIEGVEITERLKDGAEKETSYYFDVNTSSIIYKKDGSKKIVVYENGKLKSYDEIKGNKEKHYIFNNNGILYDYGEVEID